MSYEQIVELPMSASGGHALIGSSTNVGGDQKYIGSNNLVASQNSQQDYAADMTGIRNPGVPKQAIYRFYEL